MANFYDEILALEATTASMREFDFEILKTVQESMIQQVPGTMVIQTANQLVDSNIDLLTAGLDKIRMVAVNRHVMISFFEDIYNSDDLLSTPLTTPLKNTSEIEDVRPAQLQSFLDTINVTVEGITKGKFTKESLKQRFLNPSYLAMMKRNIVRTTIPDMDYKTLIHSSVEVVPCTVNEQFFTSTVLPFLRSYDEDVKEITIQAQQLMSAMNRGVEMLSDYMEVYNTNNTKLDYKTSMLVMLYLFNITKFFMELSGYASYMLARKMNTYAFNVNSLMELHQKIISFFPEDNAAFHENVVDGMLDDVEDVDVLCNLLDGDASILQQVANRICDQHLFGIQHISSYGDKFHNINDFDEDDRHYDLTPYVNLESIMTAIIKSLYTLEANCKDPMIVFDDLKEKSGFGVPLVDRFSSHINGLSDINTYQTAEETDDVIYDTIICELRGFQREMKTFSKYVHDIYTYANDLDDRIFNNINNEFAPTDLLGDTRKFVSEFANSFRDLIIQIVHSLFRRLQGLDVMLGDIEKKKMDPDLEQQVEDNLVSVENEDFIKESIISGIQDDELLYQDLRTMESAKNQKLALEHAYGVMTEADETNNQNNGQQTQQNSGQQSGSGDNQKKEGNPTVSGSGDGSTDTKGNTETDGKGNNEEGNKQGKKNMSVSEMIKAMGEFFDNILKKFLDAMDRQLEVNKKWLAAHKEELLGKKIRNRQIDNIYPYADDMPDYTVENIRACVSAINGLTVEKLNGMDNNGIDKELFGFIVINAEIPIRDKIVQWYTTKDKEMKPITLKNSEIERRFAPMIQYCETFYNGFYKNVSNALRDLKNAWTTKAKALETADTAKVMYVNKQVKYYAGAVLNAIRDRNYSYLKVLKTFVGAPPAEKNQEKNQEGQEKNTDQQQNNNNENQNENSGNENNAS